jgi:hypothetical protein
MRDKFEGCMADLGGMTLALKAQKALGEAAIPSTVVKGGSSSFGSRGCSYGLHFSCAQRQNVESVLASEGIRVKRWIQES